MREAPPPPFPLPTDPIHPTLRGAALVWKLNKTHACPGSDKKVGGREGRWMRGVKEGVDLPNATIPAPSRTILQFAN